MAVIRIYAYDVAVLSVTELGDYIALFFVKYSIIAATKTNMDS